MAAAPAQPAAVPLDPQDDLALEDQEDGNTEAPMSMVASLRIALETSSGMTQALRSALAAATKSEAHAKAYRVRIAQLERELHATKAVLHAKVEKLAEFERQFGPPTLTESKVLSAEIRGPPVDVLGNDEPEPSDATRKRKRRDASPVDAAAPTLPASPRSEVSCSSAGKSADELRSSAELPPNLLLPVPCKNGASVDADCSGFRLPLGDSHLGRADLAFSNLADKIGRHHISCRVTADGQVFIIQKGRNPCFLRRQQEPQAEFQPLSKQQWTRVYEGDVISMLKPPLLVFEFCVTGKQPKWRLSDKAAALQSSSGELNSQFFKQLD